MLEIPCQKCWFYIPHYIKYMTRLQEIEGHCTCTFVNRAHQGDKMVLNNPCAYFAPTETDKTDDKTAFLQVLRDMEKRLSDIVFLLQDE